MNRWSSAAIALITSFGFINSAAHADSVSLNLTQTIQTSVNGAAIVYGATIAAPLSNQANIYLNGDSFDIQSPLALDDTAFFQNVPTVLRPGDSYTGDLFLIFLPGGSTPRDSNYVGDFTILGGADGLSQDVLADASFTTTLVTTPEPSNILLVTTGLCCALFAARRPRLFSLQR